MKLKPAKPVAKPVRASKTPVKPQTASVTLRVLSEHLAALDALGKTLGCQRSALIQIAIGEFIARRA